MSSPLDLARRLKRQFRERREDRWIDGWCRRAARSGREPRPGGHALVLVPGYVGSVGDEAMLTAAATELRARGVDFLTLVSYGDERPDHLGLGYDEVLDLGRRFVDDFWNTGDTWLEACRTATDLLIIGADVMDGHYSPRECLRRTAYARIAHACGVRAAVLGFSCNATPHPRAVAALADVPEGIRLLARDPVSRRRLLDRLGRDVDLAADVAFLLEPQTDSPLLADLRSWIAGERTEGRVVVGFNVNYLAAPASLRRGDGRELVQAYIAGLDRLAADRRDLSLLFVAHDKRVMENYCDDRSLAEAVVAGLPESLRGHARVAPREATAREIKALAGELDVAFTGRMHFGIAVLGRGVPVGGAVYQGKFEGLFEHFGLPPLCLDPDELATPGRLAAFIDELVTGREEYRRIVAAKLPRIHELARENFAQLDPVAGSAR